VILLLFLQDPAVEKVLKNYAEYRPADEQLGLYKLDWAKDLKEAKERAARERRPVLLLVVTNSYGNLYTGHC
jgi:hypothetical protein